MAKNKEGDSRNPDEDKDTQEILDEMDQENGDESDSDADDDKDTDTGDSDDDSDEDEEDDADDEDEDDDSDEDEDEDDADDDDVDEDEEDEEDSDDDDDDEDDSDDSDDEDEDQGRRSRDRKKTVPLWQHKKALKQQESRLRKELTAAARSASQSTDDIDEDSDEVKEIVSKYKLNKDLGPGLVASILKLASKRSGKGVTDEELKRIKRDIADRKESEMFTTELAKTGKTIKKLFGSVSETQRERIHAKLRKMAYTKEYRHYSLTDILRLNRRAFMPKDKRQTGERQGSRPQVKTRLNKRYDLSNPDSIPWGDLSDEEFDEVSAALEKRTPRMKIVKRNARG